MVAYNQICSGTLSNEELDVTFHILSNINNELLNLTSFTARFHVSPILQPTWMCSICKAYWQFASKATFAGLRWCWWWCLVGHFFFFPRRCNYWHKVWKPNKIASHRIIACKFPLNPPLSNLSTLVIQSPNSISQMPKLITECLNKEPKGIPMCFPKYHLFLRVER